MDVNKLKHVLTHLKTLSDVVDKEVVKKMYMIIGSKNLIPLILPDLLLLKKTDYDANDIKFEIPSSFCFFYWEYSTFKSIKS